MIASGALDRFLGGRFEARLILIVRFIALRRSSTVALWPTDLRIVAWRSIRANALVECCLWYAGSRQLECPTWETTHRGQAWLPGVAGTVVRFQSPPGRLGRPRAGYQACNRCREWYAAAEAESPRRVSGADGGYRRR